MMNKYSAFECIALLKIDEDESLKTIHQLSSFSTEEARHSHYKGKVCESLGFQSSDSIF